MESKGVSLLSAKITEAKHFVQHHAGPLKHSTFQTYRVAKVAGCVAWVTNEMKNDFESFKPPEGKSQAKQWKAFGERLELVNRGMNHELAMCQLVEDNNFGIIKRFESHERVPKDYRKRADVVTADYKKEQQAAKKSKSESKPQNKGASFKLPANPEKEECWNCDQIGHFSRQCPLPRRNRRKKK